MRNALILANVVQNVITSACPNPQDYQAVVELGNAYCEPGWTWNGGTSFTKVVPPDVANQNTMVAQLTDAFAQLGTLEMTVGSRALTAAETRQAWGLVARTMRNLIRYAKQDYSGATPVSGPDQLKV